jgi:DNA-binding CsgD family transcriptional regulator
MTTNGKPMTREVIERRWERIAQLTREGRPASEIAAIVGMTKRSVTRVRHELGIAQGGAAEALTEAERQIVETMLDDGCSYNEIARTIGRGTSTIARHWPGRGWPPGEGGRVAMLTRHAFARIDRQIA